MSTRIMSASTSSSCHALLIPILLPLAPHCPTCTSRDQLFTMSNQDRYRDQDRERSPRDAKRSRYSDAAPSSSRKYRSPSPEELLSGRRERDRRDGKDREYSKRDERDRDRDADRSIRERERVKDGRMREDERYERDRGERTREKDRDRERDRDRDRDRERDRNRDYARSDRDRDSDRSHRYRDEPRDRDRDRERERERDSVRSKDSPRIDRNGSSTPTAPPPLTGSSTPVGSHTPQPIAPPSPLATFASPTGLTSTEEDKQRIKREKMEAWKKAQAAKKQAEEVRKVVEEKAKALSGGPKVALPSKPVIALSAGTAVGEWVRWSRHRQRDNDECLTLRLTHNTLLPHRRPPSQAVFRASSRHSRSNRSPSQTSFRQQYDTYSSRLNLHHQKSVHSSRRCRAFRSKTYQNGPPAN